MNKKIDDLRKCILSRNDEIREIFDFRKIEDKDCAINLRKKAYLIGKSDAISHSNIWVENSIESMPIWIINFYVNECRKIANESFPVEYLEYDFGEEEIMNSVAFYLLGHHEATAKMIFMLSLFPSDGEN